MLFRSAKTYYAEKMGLDPKNIVMVAVMPCTAKKFEIGREDQDAAGVPDVDIAITTRELARMIDRVGLTFTTLPDEEFDNPLGQSTGAAVIFGATGGVMEAALRTAVWKLTGENNDSPIDFEVVRGVEGIKEASFDIDGLTVNVAVASGLKNPLIGFPGFNRKQRKKKECEDHKILSLKVIQVSFVDRKSVV